MARRGRAAARVRVLKLAFDHVFTKGLPAATPGPSAGVVKDNKKASDHHPVWVLIDDRAAEREPRP